jgi:mannose-1-phosphate guanylyltransferase/mannose-1-phosphate guanylyltransferase/phosphomannomutase
MAAGLGTRLRPLTYEVPKPMVPVANRPIMEHVLRLLARHGMRDVIANLHWFPEIVQGRMGDGSTSGVDLTYSFEDELLGTAGGVRNVREFFGAEPFLVMAADPLTDIDLGELADAHRANPGIATLAVKRVPNVSEFGVVVTDGDGRIQGFQEKPDPAEALSDLANCMIYVLDPEVFDYFPDAAAPDFALDVFPALLEHGAPFHVHEVGGYWSDVGSLPEYLQGNLDALDGAVAVEEAGSLLDCGDELAEAPQLGEGVEAAGKILMGEDCEVGSGTRLEGPVVMGDGCRVGPGAQVARSVLLPGAEIVENAIVAGSIVGKRGRLG